MLSFKYIGLPAMNILKKAFISILLSTCCAVLNAQQDTRVRVIFFSDDYNITSNMQNAFQDAVLKSGSGYTIERVEKRPTLFNGNSYILNLPKDIDENYLDTANFYYRSTGRKEVILTNSSILVQTPYFDKAIKNALLKNTQDDSPVKNFISAESISARSGQLMLSDAMPLDILSTDIGRLKASWAPAVLINYVLEKDNDTSTVSIFEKPLGGIGAWYEAVQSIIKSGNTKPLIINTGGLQVYEPVYLQADFLKEYWKAMNTDVLAISSKDTDVIWPLAENGQLDGVILLASNIETVSEDIKNPFTKTQIIERDGVKIGVFSLSEEHSLDGAPGHDIQLKATNPFTAAQEALNKLRKEDKADFIILVSHLKDPTLNAVLQKNYGIDMVITSERTDSYTIRKRRTELTDWNKEKHYIPAYVSRNNGYNLGDVNINFEKNDRGLSPAVIEDSDPRDLYENNTFSNKFYAVNKELFSGITKQGDAILPSARQMSAYGTNSSLSYSPLEFFNMAAAIIRQEAKTEAAFIKILPFNEQFLGALTADEIKKWMGGITDEPVVKVKMKGSNLKKLLKMSDFSHVFSGDIKDYSANCYLASAGVVKDGDKYKINGLNLVDDEIYSISFPSTLLQERIVLPTLRSDISSIKDTDLKLPATIIEYLTKLKEGNEAAANNLFDNYRENYDLRKEENLPPQDEQTEELDLKMEDIGPRAVEEYFLEQNTDNYNRDIFKLMENKPDIHGAWRYNLKNLSFQFSNTDVKNAADYQNFSNSRLTSDSQTQIQGNLNFAAEYYKDRIRWNNILLLDYGRVTLRPYDEPKSSNESADKISISTEYTYKSIDIKNFLGGFLIGPFLSLGYQTEFTSPEDAPRYKALLGKGGIRLFEGKYLKDLYIALVPELDFTYPTTSTKYSWEFGIKVEQAITDNTKAIYRAMVRDFFLTKNPNDTDFSYEFEFDARLEMEVWKKFAIAPFVNYYQAKGKSRDRIGSNLYIGVSLSYSKLFKHMYF